jgi:pilus assembly protein CpaE
MNAPWKSGAAGTRDPFSAYICDDLTLDVVRSMCDDMGWAQEKANKGGLRNAVQSLSVAASPQILLVDLSESGDPINDINSRSVRAGHDGDRHGPGERRSLVPRSDDVGPA